MSIFSYLIFGFVRYIVCSCWYTFIVPHTTDNHCWKDKSMKLNSMHTTGRDILCIVVESRKISDNNVIRYACIFHHARLLREYYINVKSILLKCRYCTKMLITIFVYHTKSICTYTIVPACIEFSKQVYVSIGTYNS